VITLTTRAWIADGAFVNQSLAGGPEQQVDVKAESDTTLTNVAGALALSEGSASVAVSVITEILLKDTRAYIGKNAHVSAGGDSSVESKAKEDLFELAVGGAASEDAAVTGSVVVVDLADANTLAFVDENAIVHAGGALEITASDDAEKLDL